jgi:hypothetical protein
MPFALAAKISSTSQAGAGHLPVAYKRNSMPIEFDPTSTCVTILRYKLHTMTSNEGYFVVLLFD